MNLQTLVDSGRSLLDGRSDGMLQSASNHQHGSYASGYGSSSYGGCCCCDDSGGGLLDDQNLLGLLAAGAAAVGLLFVAIQNAVVMTTRRRRKREEDESPDYELTLGDKVQDLFHGGKISTLLLLFGVSVGLQLMQNNVNIS